MEYLKRTADEHLSLLLASSGAVLIEGPKWCGKTTTAEQEKVKVGACVMLEQKPIIEYHDKMCFGRFLQ